MALRRGVLTAVVLASLGLAATASRSASATPLLALHRGQVVVLIGQQPQWLPVSGRPTELTLLAGPPAPGAGRLAAYVAVQPAARSCAASASADHGQKVSFPRFFAAANLVQPGDPLAPSGGSAHGVRAAVAAITLHQPAAAQACVWIASRPSATARPIAQPITMLNGLFAASVTAAPTAGAGLSHAYSLAAIDVGRAFSYGVSRIVCGRNAIDPAQRVAAAIEATADFSVGTADCPDDETTFSFTAGGGSLGTLTYPLVGVVANPPVVARLGGCELGQAAGMTVPGAEAYLLADGCSVGRVLTAPYDGALPRGAVAMFQVDGGVAEVAPAGTAVDIIRNG
jgi:hypothetical protein